MDDEQPLNLKEPLSEKKLTVNSARPHMNSAESHSSPHRSAPTPDHIELANVASHSLPAMADSPSIVIQDENNENISSLRLGRSAQRHHGSSHSRSFDVISHHLQQLTVSGLDHKDSLSEADREHALPQTLQVTMQKRDRR